MASYTELYSRSLHNPEEFWQEQAHRINWFEFPHHMLSQDENGFSRWYAGGRLNTSYLALDYHVANGRADQDALIYDSPVTGTKSRLTYRELLQEVELVAGMLKRLGVGKGDRVVIYMPMIPQTVFAMLACARLGAIHSVVFGGFSAHELAVRIDDAKPRVLLAASGGKEVNTIIPYEPMINAALEEAEHQPESCVVFQRDFVRYQLRPSRDLDWEKLRAESEPATWVALDATDPLYILYTSGTTGKPKGVMRDNGGHAVALHLSMELIYGIKPGEVFWAASDVGWVVGHSYIVYGPLLYGATTVLFEGKPVKTPDAGTFWRVIEEYGVSVLFTAPTAFRAIRREDPKATLLDQYDLSCLRYLFLAGERTDVATYEWATEHLHVPVIDHWWQTESGWPMLANMAGVELKPIKPGSASLPVVGYDIRILDSSGQEVAHGTEGTVVVKLPLPPGNLPWLWNDEQRFVSSYLDPFPGYFFSGDGGYKDADGYVFITGRIDDIINVAGHRLSTSSMEEVLAQHPDVAECAVIAVEDQLKGHIPVGFVVLKAGADHEESDLEKELIGMVRQKIGPVAAFKRAVIAKRLPKTRSGKILRKIMRAIADKRPYSPPSTIEDPAVLDELKTLMHSHKIGQA
ncbi:MAG: propionyl-CoA synthetase [Saprospiraceae bacterium]